MGRNIPSITYRIDSKIQEWERFVNLLPQSDRAAFQKLIPIIKDRRTAIDAADEDISFAMLLAITTHLKSELLALDSASRKVGGQADGQTGGKNEAQSRLD
jgi:hypothetical protein